MRFSLSQLFLFGALCALFASVLGVVWRGAQPGVPSKLAFSPDGKLLAVDFGLGGPMVWDISRERPRRAALSFREGSADGGNLRSLEFLDATTLFFAPFDGHRTHLTVWDLSQDRPLRSLTVSGPAAKIAISPDGRRALFFGRQGIGAIELWDFQEGHLGSFALPDELLVGLAFSRSGAPLAVTRDADGPITVWSVETQERIRTIEASSAEQTVNSSALSPDGATLAQWVGSGSSDTRLELWDLAGGERQAAHHPAWGYREGSGFTPDGKHFTLLDIQLTVRVWKTTDGTMLHEASLPSALGWLHEAALSPDGQTLALASYDRVHLFDLASQTVQGTVWERPQGQAILYYTPGFLLWAFAWGGLARRRRAHRWRLAGRPLPHETAVPAPGLPGNGVAKGVVALVVIVAIGAIVLADAGVGPSTGGFAMGLMLMAGTLLVLGAALTVGPMWHRRRVRGSFEPEIARAEQVARDTGRRSAVRRYVIWAAGPERLEERFEEELIRAERRFGELLGQAPQADDPCLALFFHDAKAFNAYFARRLPLGGLYSANWLERQIALCEENCLESLTLPQSVLRVLLGHRLLRAMKGFWAPPWIALIVNWHIARDEASDVGRRQRVRRQAVAELARSPDLPWQALFALSMPEAVRCAMERRDRDRHRRLIVFNVLGESMAEYLLGPGSGERRRRFADLVLRLQRTDPQGAEALQQAFDERAEGLWSGWREWLAEQPADGYDRPEPRIERQIRETLLPRIADSRVSLGRRAEAVRILGGAGYLAGARPLIDLLDTVPVPLKEEIVWSLEAIAGRRWGESAADWWAWWRDLPRSVKLDAGCTESEIEEPSNVLVIEAGPEEGAPAVYAPQGPPLAPQAVRTCWLLMAWGGALMTCWSSVLLSMTAGMRGRPDLVFGPWLGLVGLAAGVFTMTRGVGHATRGLGLASAAQAAHLLACDIFNLVFALIEWSLMANGEAKRYFAWRRQFD